MTHNSHPAAQRQAAKSPKPSWSPAKAQKAMTQEEAYELATLSVSASHHKRLAAHFEREIKLINDRIIGRAK